MDSEELAQTAYDAYGKAVDYKNYRGEPMPSYPDLGGRIQAAWRAAADAVTLALADAHPKLSEGEASRG